MPCLLLAAATFALYGSLIGHGFVHYDDSLYVTENPNVRAGLTWQTFRWALTAYQVGNWHPLTLLSHALDCQLYGVNPAGHHFTSLLLHVLNAVLLFLLLAQATGSPGRSWLVAALFALHPVNVESVAWVAERKNVLSTLLLLTSLGAYGGYAQRPGPARYLLVALLFALGLAAKPMLVTLPCALLLLDYWPLGRIRSASAPGVARGAPQLPAARLLLEKLPLLVLSGADVAVTLAAQHAASAVSSLERFPLSVRLENGIYAYGMYLWNAIWPTRLTLLYPHPGDSLTFAQVGTALCVLAILSALVVSERRRRPQLVTGWLWFLGTLVPVIGLVQVGDQGMADRFAYVPLIGVFVMAVWSAAELAERVELAVPWRAALAAVVLVPLCLQSVRQIDYWRDNLSLWRRVVAATTANYFAEENLGLELRDRGLLDESLVHLRNAVQIKPNDPLLHLNLAATLGLARRLDDAISEYETTIRLAEDPMLLALAHAELGTAYRLRGERSQALEHYQQALKLEPRMRGALHGMRELERGTPDASGRARDPGS